MSNAPIRLQYFPRTRSFTVLWLLEELGVDYEIDVVNLNSGEHKSPEYLAKNPMGKVPSILFNGHPISETGAIALYLADLFPASKLAPAITDPLRADYLRWMLFSGSVIEPALGEKFFKWNVPSASVAWGSFDQMLAVAKYLSDRPPSLQASTFPR